MAFINFFPQGSYSIVALTHYDKLLKNMGLLVTHYTDHTKEIKMGDTFVHINNNNRAVSVLDKDRIIPPVSPAEGDAYLIPVGAKGEWETLSGNVLKWSLGMWKYESHNTIYVEDEHRYYSRTSVGKWIFNPSFSDGRVFDAWFAADKIGGVAEGKDTNILRQAYRYLKTRPEFAHCTDI